MAEQRVFVAKGATAATFEVAVISPARVQSDVTAPRVQVRDHRAAPFFFFFPNFTQPPAGASQGSPDRAGGASQGSPYGGAGQFQSGHAEGPCSAGRG